jgi:hypothetical protein
MNAIETAAEELATALRSVPELRVYTDPGASVDPPAALVGPPQLTWGAYDVGPTAARFVVIVLVTADERAMVRLWDLVPQAAAAIEEVDDAVVRQANPGTFTTGGTELPCYEIQVEVSL